MGIRWVGWADHSVVDGWADHWGIGRVGGGADTTDRCAAGPRASDAATTGIRTVGASSSTAGTTWRLPRIRRTTKATTAIATAASTTLERMPA